MSIEKKLQAQIPELKMLLEKYNAAKEELRTAISVEEAAVDKRLEASEAFNGARHSLDEFYRLHWIDKEFLERIPARMVANMDSFELVTRGRLIRTR